MQITLAVPLLVLIAGLLMHLFMVGKAADLGRIMFACGLLVTLFQMGGRALHFGS